MTDIVNPEGAPAEKGTLDHITAALARFRAAITPAGFEVRDIALSFNDDDDQTVSLSVRMGIDAERLGTEPAPVEGVSPRPGTRMLDLPPSPADPMKQAGESVERLRRKRVARDVAESARRGSESSRRRSRGGVRGGRPR
jgi:hypothetical protein